jgi:hypothetical protein
MNESAPGPAASQDPSPSGAVQPGTHNGDPDVDSADTSEDRDSRPEVSGDQGNTYVDL